MKTLPTYLTRPSDGDKFLLAANGLYIHEDNLELARLGHLVHEYPYETLILHGFVDPTNEEPVRTAKRCDAFSVTIFMAGDVSVAKKVCREECDREGLCVTVEPTTYVYTGGSEEGFRVGFINYARFPNTKESILARARKLAKLLRERCGQTSFSIVTPEESLYYSTRTEP